ncbi:hypothetical protein [Streptomyces sp. NPDC058548]|uniref:hypothetical protein n=1 Tax=unclassified Streptomyces TaxID=2593676 RepID=UPI0036637992
MTRAPKRRTPDGIAQLEGEARGAHSEVRGYGGLAGGVEPGIATAAVRRATSSGADNAIVLDSDGQAEFDEMLLEVVPPPVAIPLGASAYPDGLGEAL